MFLQNVKREQFLQHAPKNVGSVHLKAHTHTDAHITSVCIATKEKKQNVYP